MKIGFDDSLSNILLTLKIKIYKYFSFALILPQKYVTTCDIKLQYLMNEIMTHLLLEIQCDNSNGQCHH